MKILKYLILVFIFVSFNAYSNPPYTGLVCTDKNKTKKLEFFFMEKGDNDIRVFKRVSGQFMNVGKVVGQKPGSFSLWEDNNTLIQFDFAWHLDKITGVLKPFILSSGWKKVTSLPKPLNCRSQSFWY